MDLRTLREWLGGTESNLDHTSLAPIVGLSATLDREDAHPKIGDELPLLWHWLYFLPMQRQAELSFDGHTRRGRFLPPVPLPRRMWAGGRLQFHHKLHVGEAISRVSRIDDIVCKKGRAGPLIFVLIRHEISNAAGVAVTEEQDIVYRDNPRPADVMPTPIPAQMNHSWQREVHPDEILLFRYSALTFNGHRIHYDKIFVTEVENYPGLVVQGPLIATLLMDLVRRNMPQANVVGFSFRAVRPLFANAPFTICGHLDSTHSVVLWAKNVDGYQAMSATATLL